MNSDAMVANPRGRFDRTSKGKMLAPVTVTVERGRLRLFSTVLGDADPIHCSLEAALSAGYPDLVAPPSFFMPIEAEASATLRERGEPDMLQLIGADLRYLLHGDERYSYSGLIYAGDEVTYQARVADFYDKKAGAMEFVVIESTITHEERGELVRMSRTLLHRLPA